MTSPLYGWQASKIVRESVPHILVNETHAPIVFTRIPWQKSPPMKLNHIKWAQKAPQGAYEAWALM
jgi:hypothetical protein